MFRHSPCVVFVSLIVLGIGSLPQAVAQQRAMPSQQAMAQQRAMRQQQAMIQRQAMPQQLAMGQRQYMPPRQYASQQTYIPQQQTMAPPPTLLAQGPLARLVQHARLGMFSQAPPDYVGNPRQMSRGAPGPHRYEPAASETPHQYEEYERVKSNWYGYGFGVPTYNWGSFGVQYRPHSVTHRGYHNSYTQWGFRRGY